MPLDSNSIIEQTMFYSMNSYRRSCENFMNERKNCN